jgi:hypothetical protein
MLFFALLQDTPGSFYENVIKSTKSGADWEPAAELSRNWRAADAISLTSDFYGKPVPLQPTLVRSRWTAGNLYLLYVCPYRQLHLRPRPVTQAETNKLWDWDVAEAFIGTDFEHIGKYKEFEVSPQGEFVDLDIDVDNPKSAKGIAWQSGFKVRARVDAKRQIWYGEMRIPFSSLGVVDPKPGTELRLGLFRIEGGEPNRVYVAWQPTGAKSFHVPRAFGRLILR